MLSLTADYALRAVLILAREPGAKAMHADRIAEAIGAPRNYLAKTMNVLAKAGIVTSMRGPQGGFTLAIAPHRLFVAQIAEVFEEHRPHTKCLLGRRACNPADPCTAHAHWSALMTAARGSLATTSVADLLGGTAA